MLCSNKRGKAPRERKDGMDEHTTLEALEINSGMLKKLWALVKDVFAVDTPDIDCEDVWAEEDSVWEDWEREIL